MTRSETFYFAASSYELEVKLFIFQLWLSYLKWNFLFFNFELETQKCANKSLILKLVTLRVELVTQLYNSRILNLSLVLLFVFKYQLRITKKKQLSFFSGEKNSIKHATRDAINNFLVFSDQCEKNGWIIFWFRSYFSFIQSAIKVFNFKRLVIPSNQKRI